MSFELFNQHFLTNKIIDINVDIFMTIHLIIPFITLFFYLIIHHFNNLIFIAFIILVLKSLQHEPKINQTHHEIDLWVHQFLQLRIQIFNKLFILLTMQIQVPFKIVVLYLIHFLNIIFEPCHFILIMSYPFILAIQFQLFKIENSSYTVLIKLLQLFLIFLLDLFKFFLHKIELRHSILFIILDLI